jgi:hypothetical protein
MGRPPKRPSERKSGYLSFNVEKTRRQAYQAAADDKFHGNLSDFLRTAADAMAAELGHPVPPTENRPTSPT